MHPYWNWCQMFEQSEILIKNKKKIHLNFFFVNKQPQLWPETPFEEKKNNLIKYSSRFLCTNGCS